VELQKPAEPNILTILVYMDSPGLLTVVLAIERALEPSLQCPPPALFDGTSRFAHFGDIVSVSSSNHLGSFVCGGPLVRALKFESLIDLSHTR
jgi:hypothetical protein